MSASCVGTCSNCGAKKFWLSNTASLQLDDGSLLILRHPGESSDCEEAGLTLSQASDRGRLFTEDFYVCRNCGRDGEVIRRSTARDTFEPLSIRSAFKWGWGSSMIIVPLLLWRGWWEAAVIIGAPLLLSPAIAWNENRKERKELDARGLPRADAPGRHPIDPPTRGSRGNYVIGRELPNVDQKRLATGQCCDKPDWIEAFTAKDEDKIPCAECGRGVMTVRDHGIH